MTIDLNALAETLAPDQALVIVQRLASQSFQCRFWLEELPLVAARAMVTLGVDERGNPVLRVDKFGRPVVGSQGPATVAGNRDD